MVYKIDKTLQKDITKHSRKLGLKRFFQSMGYERSGELPLVVSRLKSEFTKKLNYLDIGSGDAIFPSYILKNTNWNVNCVDKYSWVRKQNIYARKTSNSDSATKRLHIYEQDFMESDFKDGSFDVITNISVIEHFDNDNDSKAMRKSASLLKPGGIYVLTTLINENYFKEFFLQKNVYGKNYDKEPVFFQRHYDLNSLYSRLIEPSGLQEIERIYFGDYDFQFCEVFLDVAWPWKPVKLLYQWANPFFARRFLSYRNYPVSRPDMNMYTSSGVFIVLTKK